MLQELVESAAVAIGTSFAFLAFVIAVEVTFPKTRYTIRQRLPGLAYIAVMVAFAAVTVPLLSRIWVSWGISPLAMISLDRLFGWSGSLAVIPATIMVLLITDLFGYWYHRMQHSFLWPIHAVHHSVEELHGANNYAHALDEPMRFLFMVIPLSLLQVSGPVSSLAIFLFVGVSPYLIHSPTTLHLGPLRYFVADNRYHRVHHSKNAAHFNRNYGTLFTVWDQLFRTAYFPTKDDWPETGLEEFRQPTSIREWLDMPLRVVRARHVRQGQMNDTPGLGVASRPCVSPVAVPDALHFTDGEG